jgi:hypothetical protein
MGARCVLLLALAAAAGCSGAAASDGDARWVARPVGMVSRVAAGVLLELHFVIESDVHDEGGGEIRALDRARGGHSVVVRFDEVASGHTRVSVKACRGEQAAERILDLIAVRIAEDTARVPPYVRGTVEGSFQGTIDGALEALDVVLTRRQASVLHRVLQDAVLRIEALLDGETFIEIAAAATENGVLHLRFQADAGDKETADRRAEELKDDFGRALRAAK